MKTTDRTGIGMTANRLVDPFHNQDAVRCYQGSSNKQAEVKEQKFNTSANKNSSFFGAVKPSAHPEHFQTQGQASGNLRGLCN